VSDERKLQHAARELYDQAEGNPRRLAMLAAQFRSAAGEARESGPLMVVGGVGTGGKPFVQMEWGRNRGQVDVDTARSHAHAVLEACTNAVADAAILQWARDELDLDQERAIVLIDAMRRYRADRWAQPDLALELETPPPDEDGA
jgi:hypothetical protein